MTYQDSGLPPSRETLEVEFTRLTAEAISRLKANELLPALSSIFAIRPLVGNLLIQLSNELHDLTPDATEETASVGGIYL